MFATPLFARPSSLPWHRRQMPKTGNKEKQQVERKHSRNMFPKTRNKQPSWQGFDRREPETGAPWVKLRTAKSLLDVLGCVGPLVQRHVILSREAPWADPQHPSYPLFFLRTVLLGDLFDMFETDPRATHLRIVKIILAIRACLDHLKSL